MHIEPIRSGTVDGKSIRVYDDLVAPQVLQQFSAALDQSPFTRNEVARPDTADYRHWAKNFEVPATERTPLFKPTVEASKAFGSADRAYRLYRSYVNHAGYGDMLFPHTDCMPGAGELTALWFICTEWNVDWGGETLFFNENEDAEFVVSPKPGRMVMFDGEISHCGRPPTRICYRPRYTFAMKLEPIAA